MIQTVLKASYNLGWGSGEYRVALGGQGNTAQLATFGANAAKVVVPLVGTVRHLVVYSPAGSHPNYTATLMVNGLASTLTCHLADTATTASDLAHEVAVVDGDDVYVAVLVSPAGSGTGYPLNLSLEFEGTQQWFGVAPLMGTGQTSGTYVGGGALGNGLLQTAYVPTARSNTYSLCTSPGVLTGLYLKTYAGAPGSDGWVGYLSKNLVLQNGAGGTVNTACTLTGTHTQASCTFTLPVAVGDYLDIAVLRTGTNAPFALAQVAASTTFTPDDPTTMMLCGGNNDAMSQTAVDWKWTASQQLSASEAMAQVPMGPRDVLATGLYIEAPIAPGAGKSRVCMLRVNGADTAATCTISGAIATACQITGLSIPLGDGDLIDLQITPSGTPAVSIGLHWGVLLAPVPVPPTPPGSEMTRIRHLRTAPHLGTGSNDHRLKYGGFMLVVESGSPRETDAPMTMTLEWSTDFGHSFSNKHTIEGARIGEYRYRFFWRRLGLARDMVFRVSDTNDCRMVLVDAYLSPDPVESLS